MSTNPVRIPLTIVAPSGRTDGVLVAVSVEHLDALEAERDRLRGALRLAWDTFEDLALFEDVREDVKAALGIREFEADLAGEAVTE